MERKKFLNRKNYELLNEQLGFDFQVIDHKKYWLEDVGYELTTKEVDLVEKATNDLHQMCFSAIDYVINKNRFKDLNIPEKLIPYIKKSWNREDWSMYGRFDFCFDGKKLKMLEYNADTPTSLIEASLAQWKWVEGQGLNDQFNSIDEKMVAWWQAYKEEFNPDKVYFTTVKENQEDFRNTEYIMDAASRAGIKTDFIFIEDMGSDGEYFYDMQNERIEYLFKLYPWEWMVNEDENFLKVILSDNCKIIEPIWKMILSNKGILAILWELFPNHEYLLPAYFSPEKLGSSYVKKPLLSREGQNVEIVDGEDVESQKGLYQSEFNVYQKFCELPKFGDVYAVVGAWVVGEEACGLGIREDQSKITANLSCFAPHYMVEEKPKANSYYSKENKKVDNDSRPTQKTDDELYESRTNVFKLVTGAIVVSFLTGLIWFTNEQVKDFNNQVDKENKVSTDFNKTQSQTLETMFPKARTQEVNDWITQNVDTNNQALFKEFYNLNKDLVIKGTSSKESFIQIDQRLSQIVFCIQGEKDVSKFEYFLDNMLFDSPEHKSSLSFLKKKYDYDNLQKIKVPSEEDILEFCDFKNFEKDLRSQNDQLNNQEPDVNKKVIIEDSYE